MCYNNIELHLFELANKKNISHAILIECADSTRRMKVALNIAKILLCLSDNRPCNECSSCRKIDSFAHTDVHMIENIDSAKSIGIDAIRSLKKDVYILPQSSEFKIYILNPVDIMTIQAQNAMLKILEEPPKSTIFILLCESSTKLLSTVKSRLQIFALDNYNETFDVNSQNDGSINFKAHDIFSNIVVNNQIDLYILLSEFSKDRVKFIDVLKQLSLLCINSDEIEYYKKIVLTDLCKKCIDMLNKNLNINLIICTFCIEVDESFKRGF